MPSLPKGKTFDCPSPEKVECLDSWMSWKGEEVEALWTYKKCTEEKYRNKEKQEHNSVKVLLHSQKFSFYYYIQYLGNSTAQTQIQKLLYSREVHNPLSPFKVFFFFSFCIFSIMDSLSFSLQFASQLLQPKPVSNFVGPVASLPRLHQNNFLLLF